MTQKNLKDVKVMNRANVLRVICEQPGLSRQMVADVLGLSKMSAVNIVTEYVDKGFFQEHIKFNRTSSRTSVGRPSFSIFSVPNSVIVLGVYISESEITCSLVNMACEILVSREIVPTTTETNDELFHVIDTLMEETLKAGEQYAQNLFAIGISAVGLIDAEEGVILRADNLPRIVDMPLKAYYEEKFHLPVVISNDMNASLVAEKHSGCAVDALSGGQQQRIAIARALVNEPEVLLLDEPLGALDLKLRKEMQLELKAMQQQLGITFIYVTHDQEEALTMSDTIAVMNGGRIQQIGDPKGIYDEPKNAFVADFIGESNIVDGAMLEDDLVRFCGTDFQCVDEGFGTNEPVDVVIRPEDIMIVGEDVGMLAGTVESVIFKGVHYEMMIRGESPKSLIPAPGEAQGAEGRVWKVHSTTMQPVGTRVGMTIVPYNIHIMRKARTADAEAVGEAEAKEAQV